MTPTTNKAPAMKMSNKTLAKAELKFLQGLLP